MKTHSSRADGFHPRLRRKVETLQEPPLRAVIQTTQNKSLHPCPHNSADCKNAPVTSPSSTSALKEPYEVRRNRPSTRLLVPDKGQEFWVLIASCSEACLHKSIPSSSHFFTKTIREGTILFLGTRADSSRERGTRARLSKINVSVSTLTPFAMSSRPVGVDHPAFRSWPRRHGCHQHHFLFLLLRTFHRLTNLLNRLSDALWKWSGWNWHWQR